MRVRSGGGRPRKLVGDSRTRSDGTGKRVSEILASGGDPEGTAASGSGNTYICGSPGLLTHRLSTSSASFKWATVWVLDSEAIVLARAALLFFVLAFQVPNTQWKPNGTMPCRWAGLRLLSNVTALERTGGL
jgi:hypothetical protein